MDQRPLPGIPDAIRKSADQMMARIQSGKIRKHLLGSTSHVRYSTIEDIELNSYCDFVKSKLFFDIMKLEGADHHE